MYDHIMILVYQGKFHKQHFLFIRFSSQGFLFQVLVNVRGNHSYYLMDNRAATATTAQLLCYWIESTAFGTGKTLNLSK